MERPVLPAPHQIALDMWRSIVDWPLDSPRSLLFHTAVTAASTLVGFVMGTLLGLVLAVLIVHSRTLDRSLFPWIIASQTVPVLAIAPIVIVALGSMGLDGRVPEVGDRDVPVLLSGDGGHGQGPALARRDGDWS